MQSHSDTCEDQKIHRKKTTFPFLFQAIQYLLTDEMKKERTKYCKQSRAERLPFQCNFNSLRQHSLTSVENFDLLCSGREVVARTRSDHPD